MLIKEIILDFTDPKQIKKLSLPEAGIEINIQYPKTPSVVIIKIKNISDKCLTCHIDPKSDIFESIDLEANNQKENESLELHFNRNLPLRISIKETRNIRTWFPE